MPIYDVTSFLQLMDIQNIRENTRFSSNKKSKRSVQEGRIIIDSEIFVHISNLFMC